MAINDLKLQKRLAAKVMKCSPKRIVFNPARLDEIKEAITSSDIRLLISGKAIWKNPKKGISRARANELKVKKSKGQRKGLGSRKGTSNARESRKKVWINKIRKQRQFLKKLRDKRVLGNNQYRKLYLKSKSGFFRSLRHFKMYLNDHSDELLIKKENVVDTKKK
ncbi:MAG: 50S ribosomal protein L19e [Nitrospiraceae bacterium]|nr:50S ribosomal protein L19e [Nitrospiraceae bacterium]